eukprot:2467602-Pyramimonas_sp.AAC.2
MCGRHVPADAGVAQGALARPRCGKALPGLESSARLGGVGRGEAAHRRLGAVRRAVGARLARLTHLQV